MFFVRSGRSGEDLIDVLPGMVAISILFGTTSMLAVTVTFERKAKAFERLLLAPIPLELLMLAKTGGAILFGVVNAMVPFCIAFFLVDLSGVEWRIVFPAVVMIAVVSAFLGLFIAVSVSEVFEAQTFSNFFRFPMIFLCGLFFPVTSLPHYLQPLSWMLPLTYGADLLQGAIAGKNMLSFPIDFLAIVLFALLLFSEPYERSPEMDLLRLIKSHRSVADNGVAVPPLGIAAVAVRQFLCCPASLGGDAQQGFESVRTAEESVFMGNVLFHGVSNMAFEAFHVDIDDSIKCFSVNSIGIVIRRVVGKVAAGNEKVVRLQNIVEYTSCFQGDILCVFTKQDRENRKACFQGFLEKWQLHFKNMIRMMGDIEIVDKARGCCSELFGGVHVYRNTTKRRLPDMVRIKRNAVKPIRMGVTEDEDRSVLVAGEPAVGFSQCPAAEGIAGMGDKQCAY